ncbi:hypothetical protein RI103_21540 [Paraburkholderia sp. FT54]|uniref:hypothetical protein n=1 Tax=Paraburkholderia sp. FT54 TaxID=3074437 RepID=UPI00287764EC|nr:hypothetical protein [Paraburkholderia sp. FT54]WNC93392.1 hypothetical protein RI103_21540 [Paraburkholderia sp. FT54]
MASQTAIRISLLITALVVCFDTHAECNGPQNQPSEQIHIAFGMNSHKVDVAERVRLGEWVSKANAKYAIQKWVTVVGSASQAERNTNALAMKRAVTVAQDALADGLVSAPLQVKTQIYPVANPGQAGAESREVTVEISPGCPNDCCDGQ